MKSLMMRSIYAGLGLLGSGTETVEELGRKLARKAAVSEKEGEKIAKELHARTAKAAHAIQKAMEEETAKVVHAVKAAARELNKSDSPKPARRKTKKHHGGSSNAKR